VHLRPWPNLRQLRTELFAYIETYDNRKRRHSTRDYLIPEEDELAFDRKDLQAA